MPGNASSVHQSGRKARSLLKHSRESIISCLFPNSNLSDVKLVFTSGGTEACNTMLLGFLPQVFESDRIVSSSIEHAAILNVLKNLQKSNAEVLLVDPEEDGIVDIDKFCSCVTPSTSLVNIMYANSETGAIQPVIEIARKLRGSGYNGPVTSDVTQALGKSDICLKQLFDAGVDAVAFSAHKLGSITGAGCLILNSKSESRCFSFTPLMSGGSQEEGLRPGTENLLAINAMSVAIAELAESSESERKHVSSCRDLLAKLLSENIDDMQVFTPLNSNHAISNTLSVSFAGCRGDDLVVALDLHGICCSSGSACSSGKQSVSHVIKAMGYNDKIARGLVRFSLDWDIDKETIDKAAVIIADVVKNMRLCGE